MTPLNLATRPFRNERLPALLVTLLAAVVLISVVAQAITIYSLRNGPKGGAQGRVAALEQQLEELRREADAGKIAVPADTLARWSLVKDMVDRRTLSWTELFSRLEAVLPRTVRLVTIAPTVRKGRIVLAINAVARTAHDGRELVRLMEERGDFRDVSPLSETPRDDGTSDFNYTMEYVPSVRPVVPVPIPSPASGKPAKPLSGDTDDSEDGDDGSDD